MCVQVIPCEGVRADQVRSCSALLFAATDVAAACVGAVLKGVGGTKCSLASCLLLLVPAVGVTFSCPTAPLAEAGCIAAAT